MLLLALLNHLPLFISRAFLLPQAGEPMISTGIVRGKLKSLLFTLYRSSLTEFAGIVLQESVPGTVYLLNLSSQPLWHVRL